MHKGIGCIRTVLSTTILGVEIRRIRSRVKFAEKPLIRKPSGGISFHGRRPGGRSIINGAWRLSTCFKGTQPSPRLTANAPWRSMVGRWGSFLGFGLFSGDWVSVREGKFLILRGTNQPMCHCCGVLPYDVLCTPWGSFREGIYKL